MRLLLLSRYMSARENEPLSSQTKKQIPQYYGVFSVKSTSEGPSQIFASSTILALLLRTRDVQVLGAQKN